MPLNDTYDFAKQAQKSHQDAFTRRFGFFVWLDRKLALNKPKQSP